MTDRLHIPEGTLGQQFELEILERVSNTPVDLREYENITISIKSPNGTTTEIEGFFKNDGSDGIVVFNVDQDIFELGLYSIRALFSRTNSVLPTFRTFFRVTI